MYSWILRRAITHAALGLVIAYKIARRQLQRRSGSIATALCTDQPNAQPVILLRGRLGAAVVPEKLGILSIVADEQIGPSVIVVVADRQAAPDARRAKHRILRTGHIGKFSVPQISVEFPFFRIRHARMIQRNVVQNVSIDYHQVAPAVIVEIEKSRTKTAVPIVCLRQA